jgi:large repetitive protein
VAGENVGTYAINQGTLTNPNYAITFNGDDFEITQLAVTVTVDPDQSKTYGDVDPVFTYTSDPAVDFELAQ